MFRSGKEGNFIVGADIAEIRGITDTATGEQLSRRGQAVLSKLESLPFPTVAAIHGPCMGGGLELALACAYRVISNDPKTALALPEVKLGIIPGFGGTQRLPRLVGLTNALDMILTGKSVYAKKAGKIGLADEVTYKEILLDRAKIMAKKAVGKPRPTKVRARRPLAVTLIEGNSAYAAPRLPHGGKERDQRKLAAITLPRLRHWSRSATDLRTQGKMDI